MGFVLVFEVEAFLVQQGCSREIPLLGSCVFLILYLVLTKQNCQLRHPEHLKCRPDLGMTGLIGLRHLLSLRFNPGGAAIPRGGVARCSEKCHAATKPCPPAFTALARCPSERSSTVVRRTGALCHLALPCTHRQRLVHGSDARMQSGTTT